MDIPLFPPITPPRWLHGGHLQTLMGCLLGGNPTDPPGTTHRHVKLADGDTIVLHDDCPDGWQPGDRAVLLLHGLAGCHRSSYLVRVAEKLRARGFRTFRMDHRGCGAGRGLARLPYHAGRSDDLRAAIEQVASLCPDSPVSIVGFSLSGNILLKTLGEDADLVHACVDRAVAINPPIDLNLGVDRIARVAFGLYDRYFAKHLFRQLRTNGLWDDRLPLCQQKKTPRRIIEFDDAFTAPASGFGGARHYYTHASAVQYIPEIRVPTLILTSADDPIVPVEPFLKLPKLPSLTLHISPTGGHLGYWGRQGFDPDRYWMDWRIVDWLTAPLVEPALPTGQLLPAG